MEPTDLAKINREATKRAIELLECEDTFGDVDQDIVELFAEKKPVNKKTVYKSKRNRRRVRAKANNYCRIAPAPVEPSSNRLLEISSDSADTHDESVPNIITEEVISSLPVELRIDTRRQVTRSIKIDALTQDRLEELLPEFCIVGKGNSVHPHVLGAMTRACGEIKIYEDIMGTYGPGVVVTDIGGNPLRHRMEKRDNVHCCNPILDAQDVIRSMKRSSHNLNRFESGEHKVADCDNPCDVYMSIHSIYYLSPDEVLDCVIRSGQTERPGLIALVHNFPEVYGGKYKIGESYESTYQRTGPDSVRMIVNGNDGSYQHSSCDWLGINSSTHKHFSRGLDGMVWSVEPFSEEFIVKFYYTNRMGLPQGGNSKIPLSIATVSPDYVGPVEFIPGNEQAVAPLYNLMRVKNLKIYSVFSWNFVWEKAGFYIPIPKELIEKVALKVVHRKRDADSFQSCVREAARICNEKKCKIPSEFRLKAVTYGAALGFVYGLGDEINALAEMLQPRYMRLFNRINSLLDFNNPLSYLMCCFSATQFEDNVDVEAEVRGRFARYGECLRTNRPVNMKRSFPKGTPQIQAQAELKPLRADFKFTDCSDSQTVKNNEQGGAFAVAPSLQGHIPVVCLSSAENEKLSLLNRNGAEVPVPSEAVWSLVEYYIPEHMDIQNQCKNYVVAYPLWINSIKDNMKKRIYQKGFEELSHLGWEPSMAALKQFVKREKQNKVVDDEIVEFTPRSIHGHSPAFNAALGPFMWQFSKELKSQWDGHSSICFASGMTGEDAGSWLQMHYRHGDTLIENDASTYDLTQGKFAHLNARRRFDEFGMANDEWASKAHSSSATHFGCSAHGIKFKFDFEVASGSQATTPENSLNNGSTMYAAMRVAGFPAGSFKIIVLGDDSLTVLDQAYPFGEEERLLVQSFLSGCGLIPKVKFSTVLSQVEFCSGVFWPVDDNKKGRDVVVKGKFGPTGYVLGPKPGKLLAKIGWSMRDLTPPQVKAMFMGYKRSCLHVPVLRTYVTHCMKLLETVKCGKYQDPEDQYRIVGGVAHSAHVDTYEFFEDRYGVTVKQMEDQLQSHLDCCKSFTDAFNWPEFELLFAIDN